jgi:hypothetical protein
MPDLLKKSKNNIRKKHNCNEAVNDMNNMFFTLFVKTKGNISPDIKFNYDFMPIFSEEGIPCVEKKLKKKRENNYKENYQFLKLVLNLYY